MRPDILLSKRYAKHHDKDGKVDFALDLLITFELREEGIVNEFVHAINQLRRKQGFFITDSVDMLSTAISIAGGATVGTVGTINAANDDVATNDVLRVDVTTID